MLAEIFGPDLLIVVLIVVVVLFGGAAIPKLARNLGSAKKEFEKGIADGHQAADGADAPKTESSN
jgi:sec-independent protein translocase protein TatA